MNLALELTSLNQATIVHRYMQDVIARYNLSNVEIEFKFVEGLLVLRNLAPAQATLVQLAWTHANTLCVYQDL